MRKVLLIAGVVLATLAAAPSASFEAGSVYVQRYGSGSPALVLLPGLTDSGKVWDSTVARYAATHTIYVLTMPGFGGRPKVGAPMLDAVIRDIAAFLPQAAKPVLIGHSMGGILAIRLAEEHGDLISGAIAIDGLPVFQGLDKMTPQARDTIAAQMGDRIAALSPSQFAAGQETQLSYMTKPANVKTAEGFSDGADVGATGEYMRELMSADLRPGLANVRVPLLEIGPFDASVDPENPFLPMTTLAAKRSYYQSLLANDPTAKVVMIDDSRHFVMLDQPSALFSAIDAFLASLGS